MIEPGSYVVIHLHTPKEQYWGILKSMTSMGVIVRAISLNSFEDWARQVGNEEETTMALMTIFFPMHRVDRVFLDESIGTIPSFKTRFRQLTGKAIEDHLDNPHEPSN